MNQEKVWDSIAKRWQEYRKVKDKNLTDFLKNKKGKLLDVGCGSGRNFSKNKYLKIYGIDFSKKMLSFARIEAKRLGINVNLKKAKTEEIPFDDGFFDYVICNAVLHCIDTPKKRRDTIKEIFRILREGGLAYISVWSRNGPRLNKIKEIKAGVNECFIPWTVGKIKYPRYTYLFGKIEMKKMLEDAGFKIISFEDDGRNLNFIVKKP